MKIFFTCVKANMFYSSGATDIISLTDNLYHLDKQEICQVR